MKLHALKSVELPGKVLSFDIVPLPACRQAGTCLQGQALKDGAYGPLAGQMSFLYSAFPAFKPALTIDGE